jgi:hypothetical protein
MFKLIATVLGIGYVKGGGTVAAVACCALGGGAGEQLRPATRVLLRARVMKLHRCLAATGLLFTAQHSLLQGWALEFKTGAPTTFCRKVNA